MNPALILAFQDELEKLARVPKAVKQYKRLKKVYEAARTDPSLFHGTHPKYLGDILREGKLRPNEGTHGFGVYTWRGRPRSTYMRYPESKKYPLGFPGLFAKQKDLKMGPTPKDPRAGGPMAKGTYSERPYMEISETEVDLPSRKTTVVADRKQLREFRDDIRDHRYRQIDSRILHLLEANMQARRLDEIYGTEYYREPTKRDLVRLLRSKKPMKRVGMTRSLPKSKKDVNRFFGQYDEMLGRTPELNEAGEYDYI